MGAKHHAARLDQIRKRLGSRKLVWFGTRGTDARPLLELDNFREVYSLVAPLDAVSLDRELCLERMSGTRVDLDNYRIDDDPSPEAAAIHRRLMDSLTTPSFLASYRPAKFLASVYYPRQEFVRYLGLFHEKQAPFEYKPWVETELRAFGVESIPWTYVEEGNHDRLRELLRGGPKVIRPNRSDGGMGIILVHDPDTFAEGWPSDAEHFLGISPYLESSIPLNVNAVVFPDGKVSLHGPSVQLIGLPGFTSRRFGYCGNDFSRVRNLGEDALKKLEDTATKSGQWLAKNGYVGAFGVDAIYVPSDKALYLSEINPRFQGSSDVSSRIDQLMGRTNMFLEHLAAHLGMDPPPCIPLAELAAMQENYSQVIVHNISGSSVICTDVDEILEEGYELMLAPRTGVAVCPEGILFRVVTPNAVTIDGSILCDDVNRLCKHLAERKFRGIEMRYDKMEVAG